MPCMLQTHIGIASKGKLPPCGQACSILAKTRRTWLTTIICAPRQKAGISGWFKEDLVSCTNLNGIMSQQCVII